MGSSTATRLERRMRNSTPSPSPTPSAPHQIRFLVVLRDPVSRAYSHWQHELRHGKETRTTFAEATKDELEVLGREKGGR